MVVFSYVVDAYSLDIDFPDVVTGGFWHGDVTGLKNLIEDINNDGHAGAPRVPKYRKWLELVNVFVQKWGERLLPRDIKEAVNSVERGIGKPLTVWA
jgi:hypothetical protein